MKSTLLKLIFSRLGPFVTSGVSFLVGALVSFAAKYGLEIDGELQLQIAGAVTGLLWLVIDVLVNRYAGNNAETIQEALGVNADRWIGERTVSAVKRAADTQAIQAIKRGNKEANDHD